MKRIATKENSIAKRICINIPFILIVLACIIGLSGGALLLFYSIVCAVAFKSAMISLVVAGGAFISFAMGLGFILLYKKYQKFYDNQMGWIYPKKENNVVTKTENTKKSFKDYLTLSNIALLILAIGAVFTMISAALGCTDRTKWVDAVSSFRQYNGYYEDIEHPVVSYPIESGEHPINKIEIELIDKVAVVLYNKDDDKRGMIVIEGYTKYLNQLVVSRSQDGTIIISENPSPKRNETLDKLLFFVFNDFSVERQVLIYIPDSYKDEIVIICDEDMIIYPDIEESSSN